MLVWVGQGAVPGGLLDKLAAVGEDECLRGRATGGDAINQVGEDDRLAGSRGQRHAQAPVAGIKVGEHCLDAFFLIVAQCDLCRWRGGFAGVWGW